MPVHSLLFSGWSVNICEFIELVCVFLCDRRNYVSSINVFSIRGASSNNLATAKSQLEAYTKILSGKSFCWH